jgi:uncharacterized membrane protein YraQ (UPF0718 family)
MSITVVVINLFALACLVYAFVKDRARAKKSLVVALKSFVRILPTVLLIVVIIGLFLAFVPPERVAKFIGKQAGLAGILVISALGAVLYIPALTSFPLAASLLQRGASVAAVAAFITTLTMLGVVTIPLEIRELGAKMTFLRNGLSFLIAILIALLMGVIL